MQIITVGAHVSDTSKATILVPGGAVGRNLGPFKTIPLVGYPATVAVINDFMEHSMYVQD